MANLHTITFLSIPTPLLMKSKNPILASKDLLLSKCIYENRYDLFTKCETQQDLFINALMVLRFDSEKSPWFLCFGVSKKDQVASAIPAR